MTVKILFKKYLPNEKSVTYIILLMSALRSKVLSAFICHFLTGSILNYTTFHDVQILLLVCTCLALDFHLYIFISFMKEVWVRIWNKFADFFYQLGCKSVKENKGKADNVLNSFINGKIYKSVIFVRKEIESLHKIWHFFRIFTACNYVVHEPGRWVARVRQLLGIPWIIVLESENLVK